MERATFEVQFKKLDASIDSHPLRTPDNSAILDQAIRGASLAMNKSYCGLIFEVINGRERHVSTLRQKGEVFVLEPTAYCKRKNLTRRHNGF